MADEPVIAYCMKCKAKREMTDAQAVWNANGTPATRGKCPVCGTTMFKMGATPAHATVAKPEAAPRHTAKGRDLVIVESPAKAKTVGRFLGRNYLVRASVGHVRDLPKSRLGVDVEAGFQPSYTIPKKAQPVVKQLRESAKDVDLVYLATDPDREGEAIAWHLVAALKLQPGRYRRVVFHEITEKAVAEGFAQAHDLDDDLINAQQARRLLDRLVGYRISPLLWRKVRSRLSAGRVQSVALRMVVEREREIQAFVPKEYWTIEALVDQRENARLKKRQGFCAKLTRIDGHDAEIGSEAEAKAIVSDLDGASYLVTDVKTGQRHRNPSPPFTTSTMQQDAGRRLGYTAQRTMSVAQQLYEGVDIGEGSVGLITYMRTDSVHVAAEAQAEARAYIRATFGDAYLPASAPQYKTRARNAQEAHEAIRPTSVARTPESIKQYLSRDQERLYELIWRRFVASQMTSAVYDTSTADIMTGRPDAPVALPVGQLLSAQELKALVARWRYTFRASGSILRFPGFLKVYGAGEGDEDEDKHVPSLSVGELLDLLELVPAQHFTEPPPRYSEATLVKALEEYGIGRPSTYAPTIGTLQARGYVERGNRQLVPTDVGFAVNDLLVQHFPKIVDYGFTAEMEADLDHIADGEADWVKVLSEFYGPFALTVQAAEKEMPEVELEEEDPGINCPQCGSKMVVKWGRFGKFISCSNYPTCKATMPYLIKTGAHCPECGQELIERKTRKGRTFFGCSGYPACKFATWNRPVPQPCPVCGGLMTQRGKKGVVCEKCGHALVDEAAAQPEGQAGP